MPNVYVRKKGKIADIERRKKERENEELISELNYLLTGKDA